MTSAFFAIRIDEAIRYFHSYCDLSDSHSVEAMRSTIVTRESRPVRAMTREERLEHIWSTTTDDYRGYAGERWPAPMQGHRTVMLYGGPEGTFLKLLDTLTDDEIAAKLPVHLRHLPSPLAESSAAAKAVMAKSASSWCRATNMPAAAGSASSSIRLVYDGPSSFIGWRSGEDGT